MAAMYDTHAEVKKFKSEGLTEEQAVALVYVIRDAIIAECPTKFDITAARSDVKEALRDFERRLNIKVGAMIVLWGVAIVTALMLFS